jgi:Beta-propeller repeat
MPTPPRPRRAIGLALLTATATGILLQLGPADASRALVRPSASAPTKQHALAAHANLPLAFTGNAGQSDTSVRYSAQGVGVAVFLTRREAVLALQRPGARRRGTGAALALRFVGANRNVAVHAEHPGKGRINYLLGNNPANWRTGLRAYERVVYRELWPGIDLVFHGGSGKLKYELLVRPGARVNNIRLAYRGAKGLSLDGSGNLVVRTLAGVFTDERPLSYQLVDGRRVPVRSGFALSQDDAFGFALGRGYDRRYPLVIDPGLLYSTYLGGGGDDHGNSVALDGAGSAYVAGYTTSADFPTTPGAFDTTGSFDAFVAKFDASGALVYSTYLGGGEDDSSFGVAVDGSGSAYVTGRTNSANFPTTPGAFDTTYAQVDAFVTKLNASGTALVYSTYLGGFGGPDSGARVALDGTGSAYVAGSTGSFDFPTTPGAFDTMFVGPLDAFVTKLNVSGSDLLYSTYLGGGGVGGDEAHALAVDGAGIVYLTGRTGSADFPTTPGAWDTTYGGQYDAFVTKLNASGAALLYSTYLGGSGGPDYGDGVAVDGAGSAYVTGTTPSADFPTTAGASDMSWNGSDDAFLTKLDASGAALGYSTYLGGSGGDHGADISLDGAANAYVTGTTSSANFPTT